MQINSLQIMHTLICIIYMAHKNKLPERYPEIIAMYAKGSANSLDLLKADFGHWPPNGLDIVNAPDIDVTFKSVFSTSTGLKRLIPSWANLLVCAHLLKSYPVSGVAFMAITAAIRGIELGGFVNVSSKPTTIHLNDMYRAFGFFQGGRRFLSHIISHEFKHVLQARDSQDSLSSALEDRLGIPNFLKEATGKHNKYLADEAEIQARLHTVIVGVYHQHEALPLSKRDLIAALAAQGLDIPLEIIGKYVPVEASVKWAKNENLHDRYADKSAIDDLNKVLSSIKEDKLLKFVSKTLPFIYGDLLELYGDRQGHKRMGHTHNIQLREVFYKSAQEFREAFALIKKTNDAEPAKDYAIKSLNALNMMDTPDAVGLACHVIRGDLYHEYGDAECVSYATNPLGKEAVKRVYQRADLTTHHRSLMRQASRGVQSLSNSSDLEVYPHMRPPQKPPETPFLVQRY